MNYSNQSTATRADRTRKRIGLLTFGLILLAVIIFLIVQFGIPSGEGEGGGGNDSGETNGSTGGGSNGGAIAGGVIGALAGVGLIIGIFYYYRTRKQGPIDSDDANSNSDAGTSLAPLSSAESKKAIAEKARVGLENDDSTPDPATQGTIEEGQGEGQDEDEDEDEDEGQDEDDDEGEGQDEDEDEDEDEGQDEDEDEGQDEDDDEGEGGDEGQGDTAKVNELANFLKTEIAKAKDGSGSIANKTWRKFQETYYALEEHIVKTRDEEHMGTAEEAGEIIANGGALEAA